MQHYQLISRFGIHFAEEPIHDELQHVGLFHAKYLKRFREFIYSIGMCRMRQFLAILRSFLSVIYFLHPPFSTNYSSISLTSSCHLFLGVPLNLVVPKFIYSTLLGILFSSILCPCPNQRNLFNHTVSVIVGLLNPCIKFFIG